VLRNTRAIGTLEHPRRLLIVPRRPFEPTAGNRSQIAAVSGAERADVLKAILPSVENRQVIQRDVPW
jgi:hypothetical protein